MTIQQLIQHLISLPPIEGEEALLTICKKEGVLLEVLHKNQYGRLYYVARQHDYLLVLVGKTVAEAQYFLWRFKRQIISLCQRLDIKVDHLSTMIIGNGPCDGPHAKSEHIDYIM